MIHGDSSPGTRPGPHARIRPHHRPAALPSLGGLETRRCPHAGQGRTATRPTPPRRRWDGARGSSAPCSVKLGRLGFVSFIFQPPSSLPKPGFAQPPPSPSHGGAQNRTASRSDRRLPRRRLERGRRARGGLEAGWRPAGTRLEAIIPRGSAGRRRRRRRRGAALLAAGYSRRGRGTDGALCAPASRDPGAGTPRPCAVLSSRYTPPHAFRGFVKRPPAPRRDFLAHGCQDGSSCPEGCPRTGSSAALSVHGVSPSSTRKSSGVWPWVWLQDLLSNHEAAVRSSSTSPQPAWPPRAGKRHFQTTKAPVKKNNISSTAASCLCDAPTPGKVLFPRERAFGKARKIFVQKPLLGAPSHGCAPGQEPRCHGPAGAQHPNRSPLRGTRGSGCTWKEPKKKKKP